MTDAEKRVLIDAIVEREMLDLDALSMLAGNLGLELMADEKVWTNAWQSRSVKDEVLIKALTQRGYSVAGHGQFFTKLGDDRRFA